MDQRLKLDGMQDEEQALLTMLNKRSLCISKERLKFESRFILGRHPRWSISFLFDQERLFL